jgi:transcriptional regulator with XRE-family HTH domain
METKIQKEFIDTGFGFPIRLVNVPMIKVRGAWTPSINYNELALKVLRALAYKESRLTGNEIKFIRTHFEMTLQEFAKRFCVTHVGVIKWEKIKNASTAMSWSTEKDIRLFVLTRLAAKAQEFANLYDDLQELPSGKPEPIHLDVKKIAA